MAVGDIFHGNSPIGANLICLVISITKTSIQARTVTTQLGLRLNRITGAVEMDPEEIPGAIDFICRLPADIHETMLGIDRKFRFETDLEKLKLIPTRLDNDSSTVQAGRYYPTGLTAGWPACHAVKTATTTNTTPARRPAMMVARGRPAKKSPRAATVTARPP